MQLLSLHSLSFYHQLCLVLIKKIEVWGSLKASLAGAAHGSGATTAPLLGVVGTVELPPALSKQVLPLEIPNQQPHPPLRI